MEAQCYPGLQGFPVRVRGWAAFQNRSTLVQPNDIQLQFSTSQVPLNYDKQSGSFQLQGSSTFFMNGTYFSVVDARLCTIAIEQPNDISVQATAEFHIWGVNRSSPPQLAVLIIPMFTKSVETSAGKAIVDATQGKAIRLIQMVPQGKEVDVLKYTTCLELDDTAQPRIINCAVAYWTKGVSITQQMEQSIPKSTSNTYPPFGIPDILFGRKVLTNFQLQADQTKSNREYLLNGSIRLAYPSRQVIDATSQDFQTSFRLIQSFTQESRSMGQNTSSLKCVAIQPSRDIQNGTLLIDPASGVRLDETVNQANQEAKLNPEKVDATIGAGDIWMTVVTVLGIFFGITAVAGLIYIAHKFLLNRSSQGLPPVPPELASHLAGIEKIITTQ
jgi:hypothetical protein